MSWLFFVLHRGYLILFLWYKHFFRIAASSISFLITLILVVLFLGVMRPIKSLFVQKLEGSLPGELIKLRPKEMSENVNPLSLFQKKPDVHFGVTKKEIRRIQSWKDVQSVHYTQMLQRPVLTYLKHPLLSNLGGGIRFDILIEGVKPSLVKPYLFCMKNFKPQRKKQPDGQMVVILPVVVPEIYVSIAQVWLSVNQLPMPKMDSFEGIDLNMLVGQSILKRRGEPQESIRVIGRVCGFIPEGIISTMGVPIRWVEGYHRSQDMKIAADSYDQIFVRVKNSKNVGKIKKRLKKYNLVSHARSKKYGELFRWISKIDYIFWSTAFILILLSGISLVNSFTLLSTEKRYEFGLYLVLGSSPLFIWVMMFFEGAIWGGIHSFLSFKVADLLFVYLKDNLPFIKLYPELGLINFSVPFQEKFWLVVIAVTFTGLSSMIPSVLLMKNKTINLIKKD